MACREAPLNHPGDKRLLGQASDGVDPRGAVAAIPTAQADRERMSPLTTPVRLVAQLPKKLRQTTPGFGLRFPKLELKRHLRDTSADMGSYTELTVAGYPLITSKSEVIPEVMTVFRETDRRVHTRRVSERNPLVWGVPDPDNQEIETTIEYSCLAREAIDRLDVIGFSLRRVRESFEAGRQLRLDELASRAENNGTPDLLVELWNEEKTFLKTVTFDDYSDAFAKVMADGLRPDPFDDRKAEGLDPTIKSILEENHDTPFGFRGGNERLLIRLACNLVGPETRVVQDITVLVDAGYYGNNEPVCEAAIHGLIASHAENAPRIILTEGSTDRAILKDALSILYPHLAEYYSFLEFNSSRSPGGAGHLVSLVKAFAGAGVTNRIVALFDNDTSAREATKALKPLSLPSNIAVLHYPDLELLRDYPTLGPNGLTTLNVNGLAASIELYLGADILRLGNEALTPVQWKGYSDTLRQYQGEVRQKAELRAACSRRATRCRTKPAALEQTDWSGLSAILQMVFSAFE